MKLFPRVILLLPLAFSLLTAGAQADGCVVVSDAAADIMRRTYNEILDPEPGAGSAIDIRTVSMAATETDLTVSLTVTDLAARASLGTAGAAYRVVWFGSDDEQGAAFGIEAIRDGGEWLFYSGNPFSVPQKRRVASGSVELDSDRIVVHVPLYRLPNQMALYDVTAQTSEFALPHHPAYDAGWLALAADSTRDLGSPDLVMASICTA